MTERRSARTACWTQVTRCGIGRSYAVGRVPDSLTIRPMVSGNLEIKARAADPSATAERCRALAAALPGVPEQPYPSFDGRHGRLKLRVEDGAGAELIAYTRPDA